MRKHKQFRRERFKCSELKRIKSGEKLVKLGNEGSVEIYEDIDTAARADYQIEMEMNRRIHLGVAVASRYAMIKIV